MAPKQIADDATQNRRFPAEIMELIKHNKLDTHIIPNEGTGTAILGPSISDVFPDGLAPYYPLGDYESLLLNQSRLAWLNWERGPRSWPKPTSTWTSWVNRMMPYEVALWRHLGIYHAIRLSTHLLDMNLWLLGAASCFWSPSCNSMLLKCGMVSPTILDIMHLTSLPALGEDINAVLEPPNNTCDIETNLSYTTFIAKYKKNSGVPDVNERTAFYLLWLCQFLFCVPGLKITKEYLNLALCIQDGRKLAFAPFLLATLYKGLFSLVDKRISSSVGGTFWLFQAWLYAYFPEVRPSSQTLYFSPCETYAEFFLSHRPISDTSFFQYLTILLELPVDRDPSLFLPFNNFSFTSSSLTYLYDKPTDLNDGKRQLQKTLWGVILVSRFILVGGSLSASKISNCGFESYNPCQWARQFGFVQDIPMPYIHPSIHEFVGSRIQFKDQVPVTSIISENEQLLSSFNLFSFQVSPIRTKRFPDWWAVFSALIFHKSHEEYRFDLYPGNRQRSIGGIEGEAPLFIAPLDIIHPAQQEPSNLPKSKGEAPMAQTKKGSKEHPLDDPLNTSSFIAYDAASSQASLQQANEPAPITERRSKKRNEPHREEFAPKKLRFIHEDLTLEEQRFVSNQTPRKQSITDTPVEVLPNMDIPISQATKGPEGKTKTFQRRKRRKLIINEGSDSTRKDAMPSSPNQDEAVTSVTPPPAAANIEEPIPTDDSPPAVGFPPPRKTAEELRVSLQSIAIPNLLAFPHKLIFPGTTEPAEGPDMAQVSSPRSSSSDSIGLQLNQQRATHQPTSSPPAVSSSPVVFLSPTYENPHPTTPRHLTKVQPSFKDASFSEWQSQETTEAGSNWSLEDTAHTAPTGILNPLQRQSIGLDLGNISPFTFLPTILEGLASPIAATEPQTHLADQLVDQGLPSVYPTSPVVISAGLPKVQSPPQLLHTDNMGIQTSSISSPDRVNTTPLASASEVVTPIEAVASPTTLLELNQGLLQQASFFQQSLANLSYEERFNQLSRMEQQEANQFFDLFCQPFGDLALNRAEEVMACFQRFEPLAPRLLEPDQLESFLSFMPSLADHMASMAQCQTESIATKAQIDDLKQVSYSLASSSARSQAILKENATLTAEIAQLEAQLVAAKAKQALLLQEQAGINQNMAQLLAQTESGPTTLRTAQANLQQVNARQRRLLLAWNGLALSLQRG